jgi:hypothetical protein
MEIPGAGATLRIGDGDAIGMGVHVAILHHAARTVADDLASADDDGAIGLISGLNGEITLTKSCRDEVLDVVSRGRPHNSDKSCQGCQSRETPSRASARDTLHGDTAQLSG